VPFSDVLFIYFQKASKTANIVENIVLWKFRFSTLTIFNTEVISLTTDLIFMEFWAVFIM